MLPSTSDSKASRAPSQPSLSETNPSLMDTHCQTRGCELWHHTKEAVYLVHIRVYNTNLLELLSILDYITIGALLPDIKTSRDLFIGLHTSLLTLYAAGKSRVEIFILKA